MDKVTRFLCARRRRSTIVETRAQRARRATPAPPQQGNMNQGQAAPQAQPAAPPAQPAAAAAPPVLPAPPAPLPVPPAPAAFALGPGRSHAILSFDDPNTGATATKLYNKAIAPLEAKFDGEADNLAVFLASIRDRARRFNWHWLITVPIDDGTTRNLLTHYGQVSLDNTRAHVATYVNTLTRDAQDNDMFYYFLSDSLTNRHEHTGSSNPLEANHHPHQGRQPCIYNAHQRNAHRVEAEVVAAQGQHHRVQPMGPQTNGPPTRPGTGGRRPPVLLMEGVQGSS